MFNNNKNSPNYKKVKIIEEYFIRAVIPSGLICSLCFEFTYRIIEYVLKLQKKSIHTKCFKIKHPSEICEILIIMNLLVIFDLSVLITLVFQKYKYFNYSIYISSNKYLQCLMKKQ